ncbi:MAG: septal ring lytic transglycosylase RlpA family protein [Proteobacteria bacterium]|jgi:rare lipoprotein A|nr:septal ring lytic transglycosylase RlpA family protein [Pseudomonadota bacterium]
MNSKFTSHFRLLIFLFAFLQLTACSRNYSVRDGRTADKPFDGKSEEGYASWYGDKFHGRKTASGETYDMYAMTAAHRHAPFGTNVKVINLDNGRETIVKINDRGPFVRGRIIDLSRKAAEEIGMVATGTAKIRLEFMNKVAINRGDIYIQAASFESQRNAQDFLSQLQRTIPTLSPRIYNENNFFRIRTGPYSTEEAAQADLARLKRANFDGFILHTD